ncbi:hypothetical protein VPNG_01351 [Cytospora leucostoma]|uniref:Uncharacterized protein n=1 Tax=Cytospora leucostoma TaxID=1230097 RepID=A0A423XKZ5_9PEZI|nr:hypothetical protein VPNG_01351 [Cytospora leucostoma]
MSAVPTEKQGRKTAIVTGGASGLGTAIAEHFASQGHNVAILDVSVDAGNELASKLVTDYPEAKVIFKQCDVSSWKNQAETFKEVYTQYGRIDIVVANAGISEQGRSALASIEDDEPQEPNLKVLDVDLSGVIYSSSYVLRTVKAVKLAIHYLNKNPQTGSSRGLIICTASNAGLYPFPVSPLYAAAKAGVIGLIRSTAPIVERLQIQINGLAPAILWSNISPDKSLYDNMVVTPLSTLVDGVRKFVEDTSLNGELAEIHGRDPGKVTLRPPHEVVDEDSRKNLENFWRLGWA